MAEIDWFWAPEEAESFFSLSELFVLARRSANNIDKIIEEIEGAIGASDISATVLRGIPDQAPMVFVEARPKGRSEHSAITDYVVENIEDQTLYSARTQSDAVRWAKSRGYSVHVARIRHLNNKRIPDHWMAV